jgi:hypothetical protein
MLIYRSLHRKYGAEMLNSALEYYSVAAVDPLATTYFRLARMSPTIFFKGGLTVERCARFIVVRGMISGKRNLTRHF